ALAVKAEDVLVGAPVRNDLLALLGLLDGADLITQPGRLLKALRRRGRVHAGAQRGRHLAAAPLEKLHRLAQVLLVHAPIDRNDAGPETALDVVLDAGAGAVAKDGVAARPQREDLADGVERLAHRRCTVKRPEVPAAVLDDPSRHQDPRPRLPDGDLHADVALVV